MRGFMEQLVGNEKLKNKLCSDILSDTFSHAYILEGSKGSGRHTVARLACAAISCENKKVPGSSVPCLECRSCQRIMNFLSPDVITVSREEDKATMSVDVIRRLREDVYTVPNDLDNKIYIIEDADKMTDQAQNAFLLTLEEPPAYVGFFLICENSGALLETIRSRAPVLRTEPLSSEKIDSYISANDRRAAQMKLTAKFDYAELLMASKNGIGNALALLEPQALAPIISQRKLVYDFVRAALGDASSSESVSLLSRFSAKRETLSEELRLIILALRDVALLKKSDSAVLTFYSDRELAIEHSELASLSRIFELSAIISRTTDRIAANANVRLTMLSLLSDAGML